MIRKLSLVCFLLALPPAIAQSNKREAAFVEYANPECKFTIYYPGKKPTVATKKVATNAGEVQQTTATYESKDATYTVTVTELPGDTAKAGLKVLADGVRDALKGNTGKVETDNEITHGEGKLKGREMTMDFGRNWARTRVFVSDSKLYQVTVTGSKSTVTGTTADKFVASFGIKE